MVKKTAGMCYNYQEKGRELYGQRERREKVKKYTFCLTKREALEFCVRAVCEQYRRRWGVLVLWGFLCVMEFLFYLPAGFWVLLLFFALAVFDVARVYSGLKKGFLMEERTIWLEDGKIKCNAGSFGEMECARFSVIRKSKRLLMLGYLQSKRKVAWYVIPMRAFEEEGEAEAFLAMLRQQAMQKEGKGFEAAAQKQAGEHSVLQEQADALFHFSFLVNEAMWMGIYQAAFETISSGTVGPRQNRRRAAVLIAVLGISLMFARIVLNADPAYLILLVLLLCIFLSYMGKGDPKARIRRQIRRGMIQTDVYGLWDIKILEEGVLEELQERQLTFMPWVKFGWLVETEKCFFLFGKEKLQFIPIPKCSMRDAQQAAKLMELCAGKGLTVTQGKRRKYWPGWVFGILFAVVVLAFLGLSAGRAFWDHKKAVEKWTGEDWTAEDWTVEYGDEYGLQEEFDPADYPDYVPLEQQAEILRSLGLDVPENTVESVREWMEEYGIRVYVEGYPFTYLLTELGMPLYNEEWEIVSYPKEVFWFDFEGWDLGQDYVTVLTGMQQLAEGSILDQVENIRTDVSEVDWDAGTGTVKVMLDFQGQEYSFNMEVMYDWIDGNVLGIFNSLLTETREKGRFYATGDNGQGALVFFAKEEWAREFEKATGLELELCVSEQKKGAGAVVMTVLPSAFRQTAALD